MLQRVDFVVGVGGGIVIEPGEVDAEASKEGDWGGMKPSKECGSLGWEKKVVRNESKVAHGLLGDEL